MICNHDVSNEDYRAYHFPDGEVLFFDNPYTLQVNEDGLHYLYYDYGKTKAIIQAGWLWIEIGNKPYAASGKTVTKKAKSQADEA